MKKLFFPLLLITLITASLNSFAQATGTTAAKTPRWLSSEGFWVIEHQKKTPKDAVIYFYNNNSELVYQERVSGMRLNVNRKKVLVHLNNVLTQALVTWKGEPVVQADRQLVRTTLKRH